MVWDLTLAGNPAFAFLPTPPSPRPPEPVVGVATAAGLPEACGDGGRTVGGPRAPLQIQRWSVAVFDLNYIATTLLPELFRRYLPGGSTLDYDIRIVNDPATLVNRVVFPRGTQSREAGLPQPDWHIGLFSPRLDCFTPDFRPRPPTVPGLIPAPAPLNLTRLLTQKVTSCRTISLPESAAGPGLWTLQVNYRPLSTEGALATFRRRSVLFSGGVLLVLGLGVFTLILLSERASALAEMRSELVLGVSHELRTPLTVIRVAADNLARGMAADGEQARNYGQLIGVEAARLSDMIEDTLAFARLQSGRRSLDTAPVDVAELVASSLANCQEPLRDAGVRSHTDIAPNLPPIEANARLIGKCLENLVQNVIRYAAVGHWMVVSAHQADRPEGSRVRISVADHGPGIPITDLPHIFEPFYRGRNGAASTATGLGLGLTFVKRVVEAHRGNVEVEVTATGTVFSLFLRCHDGAISKKQEFQLS
jgi:signal transduction histidine kinase